MKKKIAAGLLLLSASALAVAQRNGSEWPVAAASLMVNGLAEQNQAVLALVMAPDAIYFPGLEEQVSGRSSPFSLNSLDDVRNRCELDSVEACNGGQAQVNWKCAQRKNGERDSIYSRVAITNGKISSVVGNASPQLCRSPRRE